MPVIQTTEGKPTFVLFGSDEEVQGIGVRDVLAAKTEEPLDRDKPIGISVIITHTRLGWSFSVESHPSRPLGSLPEARDAVREWLRHWAESEVEVEEVRNFNSPDRYIPADGSVPGG